MLLTVAQPSLVVLAGTAGSGKSSLARRCFTETEILSSDRLRAMISDDEADQSVSAQAFEVLYLLARHRLRAGRLTVVDATSTSREARARLIAIARECGVEAVAIVFDIAVDECLRNDAARTTRNVGRDVILTQRQALDASLAEIDGEGFARIAWIRSRRDADEARIVRDAPAIGRSETD